MNVSTSVISTPNAPIVIAPDAVTPELVGAPISQAPSADALSCVPVTFARRYQVLPLARDSQLSVAVTAKTPVLAISELSRSFGALDVQRWDEDQLLRALDGAYTQSFAPTEGGDVADAFDTDLDLSKLIQDLPEIEDLQDSTDSAPIIRMINMLFRQARRDGASDIHIEPFEQISFVRFRVDGTLRDIVKPRKSLHAALISRIKIMAQLDIAEKRLPQDGRISIKIAGRPIDVRVSTLPTGHGERAVLRLLDKDSGSLDLGRLGMDAVMLARFRELINLPHGIVLVTGPTGSGKTTTLYAGLSHMDASRTNIMTVEDPIEYDLEGVGQTQINNKIEMSFARALRAILRQDPDVIMIGEIRDLETAQIAVQASLTGHLVLATLHTNDASAAVTRLVDMGVEPFLLASSLSGVLAQRLVRKLCSHCKKQDEHGEYEALGCRQCGGVGYTGRTGIYELLEIDQSIRNLVHNKSSEHDVRHAAVQNGMVTMREDGERWVKSGATNLAEIIRVTRD